ncbi:MULTISPECIES: helix-turn-helix transcriptional regulator [Kitasatospora]|uniref:Putative transcriptional regulator n=1 Tax=Kitasatospora setae (strain ATCC 33774 / DSM 43861 / JCM 3304 / KCC A-0304 / NBRC 14216 / KM-6054) TaxID=452652 RepID=E4N0X0_KITSK|nr:MULTISPECIES: helix-turn-helix transcriptional regulator [Kitasatospora]BAJ31804.1 putative transcriptional regulator [Kitasatospora setae KM-6054]
MAQQERVLHPDRSARDLFGFQLRKLRKEYGISIAVLAAELGRGKTAIGNVETADRPIPLELPEELDRFFQTDGLFAHLFKLSLQEGFPEWSRRYVELEALACEIRKYAAATFPGLWQDDEYGLALIRLGNPRAGAEEVARKWASRKARQELLAEEDPPLLWVVLDEAVVRRRVGGPEAMRRQVQHVLDLTEQPGSVVQVMPFAAGGHGALGGSTTLLDFADGPRAAYVEDSVSGRLIESAPQVRHISLTYNFLQAAALSPEDSRDWLRRVKEEI